MYTLQIVNLGARFLLEICALGVIAFLGWKMGSGFFSKITLSVSFTLIVMVIWGIFGSPKAPFPLNGGYRMLLELGIFGIAVVGLYVSGKPLLAILFASVIIVNRLLSFPTLPCLVTK
ncbi:hypothetical protein BTR23_19510 [Alkalihalophilus pseudofirmus]|nr:hypothetical protein BTR23_19510 [Alkalihalophilus pseudofirmus]